MTFWPHDFARSRDKLKQLNLPYHSAYGHQCWQDGTYVEGLLTIKSLNALFWSCVLAKSRDKWKLLYFHYHSACDHQTWQDVDLPLWAPTCKITWLWSRGLARSRDKLKLLYPLPQCLWPSDCLILRDHMTS